MSVFLCGNTGFQNRGCEAIVSSTVQLLPVPPGDIYLTSFDPKTDAPAARRYGVNLLPYENYPTKLHRLACGIIRKLGIFKHCGFRYVQGPLYRRLKESDLCLNVGGDVYCYGRPTVALALDSYAKRKHIKNVLWCCSIEKESLTREILTDLRAYRYILARESLTVQNLKEAGLTNVLPCCDPAFFLPPEPMELPAGFQEGNTVGVNLSPLVAKGENLCYQNVVTLIRYLLEQTDFHICLIPHVYTILPPTQDYNLLLRLREEFPSDRISILDRECRCEEIKFLISKCRFMIAARTHASIAAYSTGVPTLVIGYSVKSKGIATDLFHTWEDYVLPYEDMRSAEELKDAFLRLTAREEEIRATLAQRLPAYRQTLLDAIQTALPELAQPEANMLCREELCTGCTACASVCPRQAISMRADQEGFLRPVIDETLCVHCGSCRAVCPSLHRFPDTRKTPDAFAVQNRDKEVRLSSSSGGGFQLLAETTLKRGGVVVGAALNPDHRVVHQICSTEQELEALKTSKYVQSDMRGLFPEIRRLLAQDREVLFSGTPCQNAGLRAYLGEAPANLICVDLICHGVPSPAVWKSYCDVKEPISRIRFRDKTHGWKRHGLRFTHPDGAEEMLDVTQDPYLKCFVAGHSLRPSCYLCPAKQLCRPSDITLGDFWGVERLLPELSDDCGTSLVLVHSERGRALFEEIQSRAAVVSVPFSEAISSNRSYWSSVPYDRFRGPFFKLYHSLGVNRALQVFSSGATPYRLLRGILRKL